MSDAHVIRGPAGSIEISSGALTQLVVRAAESADGARVRRPRRGLEIEVREGHVRVEVALAARFGTALPGIAREVQDRVADVLRGMCGLVVDAVDVTIEELDE